MSTIPSTGTAPPASALQREIKQLAPWFHNLHLPDGIQTCPDHWLGDFPQFKWEQLAAHIPEDLAGWTCLDIGCNAGFYSFELARRGARVTGIDLDEKYLRQARWACRQFGMEDRVSFEQKQVYDLARDPRTWDLVLFMGVFYHLRYPMFAMDIVARKVQRLMVFQTLEMPEQEVYPDTVGLHWADRERLLRPGWPKMAFFEHGFAGDPTNWWAPNRAGCEAMLRSAGFRITSRPGHEIYLCQPVQMVREPAGLAELMEEEYRSAAGLGT